jgi:hypothetical protein
MSRAKVVPAPPPQAAFAVSDHDSPPVRTQNASSCRGSRVAFRADDGDDGGSADAGVHPALLSAPSASSSLTRNRRASMTVSQMARLSHVKLPTEPMLGGPLTVQVDTIRADGTVVAGGSSSGSGLDTATAADDESASDPAVSRKQKYQVGGGSSTNARRANVDDDFAELASAASTALDPVSRFRLAWTAARYFSFSAASACGSQRVSVVRDGSQIVMHTDLSQYAPARNRCMLFFQRPLFCSAGQASTRISGQS